MSHDNETTTLQTPVPVSSEASEPNSENNNKSGKTLSAAQKARIERNRQKALLLRQARLVEKNTKNQSEASKKASTGYSYKLIDSGGGFFIDADEAAAPKKKYKRVVEEPPPLMGGETLCADCDKIFLESYLLKMFDHSVCDNCKDMDVKHKLIPKTEAKSKYQLTDVDLDKREPTLKFFSRKNPHNPRWGEMKLYLELQVEKRALEVHESFEQIEAKREEKVVKKEAAKKKKYKKVMDNLRKEVRSSLYTKDTQGHEHEYGPEVIENEDDDLWKKTCKTCGHELTFEKM